MTPWGFINVFGCNSYVKSGRSLYFVLLIIALDIYVPLSTLYLILYGNFLKSDVFFCYLTSYENNSNLFTSCKCMRNIPFNFLNFEEIIDNHSYLKAENSELCKLICYRNLRCKKNMFLAYVVTFILLI